MASHDVVDQPSGSEESEDGLGANALHIRKPSILPVTGIIVVAALFELHGEVEERFTSGVNVQLAIDDPAGRRAVFHCVPDVAIAGDDAVALRLEFGGCCKELVPARSDLVFDDGGIIGSPSVNCQRATIDERTAGCLIAETDQSAVARTGADVDGVLRDVSIFGFFRNIDAHVGILRSIAAHVALRVLKHECGFGAVHIRGILTASGQSLVQSGLVETIGGGDDGRVDGVAEIRMRGNVLVQHLRNFVRERVDVDDFVTCRCRCFGGGGGFGGGCSCRRFRCGVRSRGRRGCAASKRGQHQHKRQNDRECLFHCFLILLLINCATMHTSGVIRF